MRDTRWSRWNIQQKQRFVLIPLAFGVILIIVSIASPGSLFTAAGAIASPFAVPVFLIGLQLGVFSAAALIWLRFGAK